MHAVYVYYRVRESVSVCVCVCVTGDNRESFLLTLTNVDPSPLPVSPPSLKPAHPTSVYPTVRSRLLCGQGQRLQLILMPESSAEAGLGGDQTALPLV